MSDEITFEDLGLNQKTTRALKENNFVYPTKVQKMSIKSALEGYDVMGAAKTGSGKTLAFLIPVFEILTKKNWKKEDGVGCLIITPTRELALQIFEVLKKMGIYYEYSLGIIFGGKNIKDESRFIQNINILIATPGRLLQHMDQTSLFDCLNLQILVIDEADKLMELDFAETFNAILENIPKERQTLLFSATMNKSVDDLARLSLNNPIYINAHEDAKFATPKKLKQFYTICELDQKLNFLYTFIKTHLKSKIIVFMSCCKQVRFAYKSFCHFTPGTVLMALHGSQKQAKRFETFENFSKKSSCVLFATDLAARGLDFPSVDWVIQLDCPNEAQTYIHRVGRTARFNNEGNSLLVLLPTELALLKQIESFKVPIQQIFFKETKITNITPKLASFCAMEVENKEFAQQYFLSYLKSLYLLKGKKSSTIQKLPLKKFSASLGLINQPDLPFIKKKCFKPDIPKEINEDDDFLKPADSPTSLPVHDVEVHRNKNRISKPKIISKAKLAKKLFNKGIIKSKKTVFKEDE